MTGLDRWRRFVSSEEIAIKAGAAGRPSSVGMSAACRRTFAKKGAHAAGAPQTSNHAASRALISSARAARIAGSPLVWPQTAWRGVAWLAGERPGDFAPPLPWSKGCTEPTAGARPQAERRQRSPDEKIKRRVPACPRGRSKRVSRPCAGQHLAPTGQSGCRDI